LEPDLGYPEFATSWPKRGEWTDNTISHNTVIVDSQRQQANWGGHPVFFKTLPGLSAGEVRSANVYEQCDVYARTLAMVDAGQGAYGVDVFRVRGGRDHLLSFHAVPGDPEVAGLSTVAQEGGTYAGPQVPFGQRQSNDVPLGFSWLYDVERDAEPGAAWSVDWHVPDGYRGVSAEDDLHLRWHNLTQVDEVALAHGDPPQNKSGNPRRLRYVLARRQGDPGLASTFVSVHEPYRGDPLIRSVERIECGEDAEGFEAVAVRIELADGAVDWVCSARGEEPIQVRGGPRFAGRLAFVRLRDGAVERGTLIAGTELALSGFRLAAPEPAWTGTIVRMDRDMLEDGRIWVDTELPTDDMLVGESIVIDNDEERNACYTIERVERDGDLTMLSLGEVSFVRDFADRSDYSKGYVYNFEEGASFAIPHHVAVTMRGGVADIATTAGADVTVEQ
ncbi:MAG: heparinase II/III family protein, partial [Armatimonadota bacterium]|nr:heparinase II/III family protein [Armatimonadota bacterium]